MFYMVLHTVDMVVLEGPASVYKRRYIKMHMMAINIELLTTDWKRYFNIIILILIYNHAVTSICKRYFAQGFNVPAM